MKGRINFRCEKVVERQFERYLRSKRLKKSAVMRKILVNYLMKEGYL